MCVFLSMWVNKHTRRRCRLQVWRHGPACHAARIGFCFCVGERERTRSSSASAWTSEGKIWSVYLARTCMRAFTSWGQLTGGGGDEGIKDSVQADSLFIHPLPPTTTTPLNMPVGECSAIRSLQMKTSLIWSHVWGWNTTKRDGLLSTL